MRLSSLSTEYVHVPWTVNIDPTGDDVEMAFTTAAKPEEADWHAAAWEAEPIEGPNSDGVATYVSKCLVGTENGGVELDAGTYKVHGRVTDHPEIPVKTAPGVLQID